MLRYYTYYSVGGYKDLYLGNSTMNQEATYFLPLLSILRKRAETSGNKEELEVVARKEALPKILHVTQNNTCDMPKVASRLISHGGYKLLFLHDADSKGILVIRDIVGDNRDESGRAVPFLIMVTADTFDEIEKLRHIATYWSNHIGEVSQKVASLITYDRDVNGIRFALHEFNKWITTTEADSSIVETIKGNVQIGDTMSFLLISAELSTSAIKSDLGLSKSTIKIIPIENVLPLDNPTKTKSMFAEARAEAALMRKRKIALYAIGGVITIGIIIYVISTKH